MCWFWMAQCWVLRRDIISASHRADLNLSEFMQTSKTVCLVRSKNVDAVKRFGYLLKIQTVLLCTTRFGIMTNKQVHCGPIRMFLVAGNAWNPMLRMRLCAKCWDWLKPWDPANR